LYNEDDDEDDDNDDVDDENGDAFGEQRVRQVLCQCTALVQKASRWLTRMLDT